MAKQYKKHEIEPDPLYESILVSKFINHVMKKGQKETARGIVYKAFDIIKKKTKKEPLDIFQRALDNTEPQVEVRPRRVGGATYQVPHKVRGERGTSLAMRWILDIARKKSGNPMHQRLAEEIMLASENKGDAIRKKINIHKMADANKAFAYLAR